MTESKKQGLLAISITCVGFLLNLVGYFPGFMSPDSLDQYQQALTHRYSDWHPPIMAGLWSLLIRIYPGGHLMFLLQLLAFWVSFFMLVTLSLKQFKRMTGLVVLLFFAPFIQNFVGNIWKDVQMAISWLLAIAMMLRAYYDARGLSRAEAVICFVLLSYGCWVRSNALPGVLPLLGIWWYMKSGPVGFALSTKRFLLNIAATAAIIMGLQVAITKLVLKPAKMYPECKLFMHDLAGIYKETGQLYFPDFIKNHPGFDTTYIRQKYMYATFDNIWWNSDNKQILPDVSGEEVSVLRTAWIKAILAHPFVYFKNRTIGFLQFLRITNSGSRLAITYQYIHPNTYGFEFKKNGITRLYYSYVEQQRAAPYLQPWFWLLINLLVLYLAKKPMFYPDRYLTQGLAYSSLFYIALEYIVFQTDTEFRYFYWNCMALSLAITVFAFRYTQNKAAKAIE